MNAVRALLLIGACVLPCVACRDQASTAPTEQAAKRESVSEKVPGGSEADFGGIEFRFVPAGEFFQGGVGGNGASPQRKVRISTGFWLAKYEITQAQWVHVMGQNPSEFTGAELPVESISWVDATKFCTLLSERHGGRFRLPSEAEWEYACYSDSFGAASDREARPDIVDLCWCRKNSEGKTHPVGAKQGCALGFHDMLGNVAEWCLDTYMGYEESEGVLSDPVVMPKAVGILDDKIARGGSYASIEEECSYSYRNYFGPDTAISWVGLRVLREDE
jgi:formylglycine-generating enzyme required for sulfatase activity